MKLSMRRARPDGQPNESEKVAQSCNRPRFKCETTTGTATTTTTTTRKKSSTTIPSTCLIISTTAASLALPLLILLPLLLLLLANNKGISCDEGPTLVGEQVNQIHQRRQDINNLRVASFATKLEQYLQCNRINLLQAINQQQRRANLSSSAASPAPIDLSPTANDDGGQCRAHFDGHLCWPAARPGETVQLACPRLNLPPMNVIGAIDQTQQDKQRNQSSIIDNDDNNNDSSSSPTSPSVIISSIKKQVAIQQTTVTAAAGQSPPAVKQVGVGGGVDLPVDTKQAGPSGGVAQRKCKAATAAMAADAAGQWQEEANYGQCADGHLFDPTDQYVKLAEPTDAALFDRLAQQLDRIEANIDPYGDVDLLEQWSLCIGEIIRDQQTNNNNDGHRRQPSDSNDNNRSGTGQPFCPIIFDGWRCWPTTRAGEVALVSCPSNQPGFSAESKAHKICTQEGDWYRHPMTNRYWSNYTTCVDTADLAFRTKILNLYVIGNVISLIALAASLIIFVSFKSLNCTRVTIHKNLFLSFITNNLMWIIWYTYVVKDADLLQSNPIECQFWHILLHYFLVSNYFWMFCEGLYLHTLLVVAFVSEDKILKWFYLLGWLTPVPITIAYAYNRSYDDYYTNFCWMEESPHNIILMAPIGISLLLNLVFLINIVRVLVTKLRANNSPDTHQTRKAVRATLILIPLLGLHYMLTPFRPEAKSGWEVYYEIIAAVCTSFQGLCVALLFCFCNGEVISVIKKKLKDSFKGHEPPMRSRSNTAVTGIHNANNFNGITTTTTNNYNNFNGNHANLHRHQLETSHTLRSVVSSSTNGDLIQPPQLTSSSTTIISTTTPNNQPNGSSQLANMNNNNNYKRPHANYQHQNSQTSSLLTTVESTPVHHQTTATTTATTTTTGNALLAGQSAKQMATTSLAVADEEAVKLL